MGRLLNALVFAVLIPQRIANSGVLLSHRCLAYLARYLVLSVIRVREKGGSDTTSRWPSVTLTC